MTPGHARVVGEPFLTIQGEGSRVGTPSLFVRFAGCDLRCSWCDTKGSLPDYDVKARSFTLRPIGPKVREIELQQLRDEVVQAFTAAPGADLVITGGEPTLQPNAMEALIRLAYENGRRVTVETNFRRLDGLTALHPTRDLISASPKVNVSVALDVARLLHAADDIGCSVQAKIVVANAAEVDAALKLAEPFVDSGSNWVALVPEAGWLRNGWLSHTERPEFVRRLADAGVRFVAQMHPVIRMA